MQARKHLDSRLQQLRPLVDEPRPPRGWVRAIRDALGMSSTELASRLHVSQSTIPDLERNEARETVQLDTLRRAADALECDLVYFLVPRTTLDDAVRAQARHKAELHLAAVAHNMRLEDEMVSEVDAAMQLDELGSQFIDKRGLWSERAGAR
ncbi:MAG TPA: mobile mystery protein A [Acidimicrobiales bacterium]|nr:mobile mystery protein A [Acidimicrobiales bacterium]